MVAAFRYRDGAYLVLECAPDQFLVLLVSYGVVLALGVYSRYAHKGDLHNILVGAGKLEEDGMVVTNPIRGLLLVRRQFR